MRELTNARRRLLISRSRLALLSRFYANVARTPGRLKGHAKGALDAQLPRMTNPDKKIQPTLSCRSDFFSARRISDVDRETIIAGVQFNLRAALARPVSSRSSNPRNYKTAAALSRLLTPALKLSASSSYSVS